MPVDKNKIIVVGMAVISGKELAHLISNELLDSVVLLNSEPAIDFEKSREEAIEKAKEHAIRIESIPLQTAIYSTQLVGENKNYINGKKLPRKKKK